MQANLFKLSSSALSSSISKDSLIISCHPSLLVITLGKSPWLLPVSAQNLWIWVNVDRTRTIFALAWWDWFIVGPHIKLSLCHILLPHGVGIFKYIIIIIIIIIIKLHWHYEIPWLCFIVYPIIHCFWLVFLVASSVSTELMYVSFCWSANTGMSMREPHIIWSLLLLLYTGCFFHLTWMVLRWEAGDLTTAVL